MPEQRLARLRAILNCDLLVLDDLFLSRTIPDDAGALLQTPKEFVRLKQASEFEQRRCIRHSFTTQIDAHETAQSAAVLSL